MGNSKILFRFFFFHQEFVLLVHVFLRKIWSYLSSIYSVNIAFPEFSWNSYPLKPHTQKPRELFEICTTDFEAGERGLSNIEA